MAQALVIQRGGTLMQFLLARSLTGLFAGEISTQLFCDENNVILASSYSCLISDIQEVLQ